MADRKIKNEIDYDYRLAGIATSLKEYTLCYHLNQLLNCDFRKLEPLVFEPKDRTRKLQFSVFKAEDELQNCYVVYGNKNAGEFLLPEVNQFDYIVQVKGKTAQEPLNELIKGIGGFPDVVMSAEIPLKKIKSRERLVYEEERPHTKRFKAHREH